MGANMMNIRCSTPGTTAEFLYRTMDDVPDSPPHPASQYLLCVISGVHMDQWEYFWSAPLSRIFGSKISVYSLMRLICRLLKHFPCGGSADSEHAKKKKKATPKGELPMNNYNYNRE